MTTRKPIVPIAEEGRIIDREKEDERIRMERNQAWEEVCGYLIIFAISPFVRTYYTIKSFFKN